MTETRPPLACLIGWPAAHSRSPLIHRYWLRTLGIDGGYVIEAVPPDDFRDFVLRLSPRGFGRANVPIPHKERALALSKPDARADAAAPGWDKIEEALVLGAGGSSRAVLFGLLDRGIKRVHLVSRTRARADALARQFGDRIHVAARDQVTELLPRAELLVNTTPLGMHGQPALDIDAGRLPASAV